MHCIRNYLLTVPSDSTASRSLSVVPGVTGGSSNNSIQICTAACFSLGYHLSGTEFSDECYCDTELRNGATSEPLTDCSMTCSGNSSEFCGGTSAVHILRLASSLIRTCAAQCLQLYRHKPSTHQASRWRWWRWRGGYYSVAPRHDWPSEGLGV